MHLNRAVKITVYIMFIAVFCISGCRKHSESGNVGQINIEQNSREYESASIVEFQTEAVIVSAEEFVRPDIIFDEEAVAAKWNFEDMVAKREAFSPEFDLCLVSAEGREKRALYNRERDILVYPTNSGKLRVFGNTEYIDISATVNFNDEYFGMYFVDVTQDGRDELVFTKSWPDNTFLYVIDTSTLQIINDFPRGIYSGNLGIMYDVVGYGNHEGKTCAQVEFYLENGEPVEAWIPVYANEDAVVDVSAINFGIDATYTANRVYSVHQDELDEDGFFSGINVYGYCSIRTENGFRTLANLHMELRTKYNPLSGRIELCDVLYVEVVPNKPADWGVFVAPLEYSHDYGQEQEIISQELEDCDGDEKTDMLYFWETKDNYRHTYLHLSSSGKDISMKDDFYIGKLGASPGSNVEVFTQDITMDGVDEIIIRCNKSTTTGNIQQMKVLRAGDEGFLEFDIHADRTRLFVIDKYLTVARINCPSVPFAKEFKTGLINYSYGMDLYEGETTYSLSPTGMEIIDYEGEPTIKYTYTLGHKMHISIDEYVSYKDGNDTVLAMVTDSEKNWGFEISSYSNGKPIEEEIQLDYEITDEIDKHIDDCLRDITYTIYSLDLDTPFLVKCINGAMDGGYSTSIRFKTAKDEEFESAVNAALLERFGQEYCDYNHIKMYFEE